MTPPGAPRAASDHYEALVRRLTLVLADVDAARSVAADAVARAGRRQPREERDARMDLIGAGLRLAFRRLPRSARRTQLLDRRAPSGVAAPAWLPGDLAPIWWDLTALPAKPRAALLCSLLDSYAPQEIATMIGATPGTVRAWIVTARLQLLALGDSGAVLALSESSPAEDLLRGDLAALEASVPMTATQPDLRAVRLRRLRSWLVPGAAVLVIGVAVALVAPHWLARPTGDGGEVGLLDARNVAWTVRAFPAADAQVAWMGVVGTQLFVTGRDSHGPAAWTSTDGVTFQPVRVAIPAPADGGAPGQMLMSSLAGHGDLLLAVGSVPQADGAVAATTVVWRSTDGGRSWTEIAGGIRGDVLSLFSTADGIFALAAPSQSRDDAGVMGWLTTDGNHWEPATIPAGNQGGAMTFPMAGTGRGKLAVIVGASIAADNENPFPAAWVSTDGWRTWRMAGLTADRPGEVGAVAVDRSGFAATGSTTSGSVIWRSSDGETWTFSPLESEANRDGHLIVIGDPGLVAITRGLRGRRKAPSEVAWFIPHSTSAAPIDTDLSGALAGSELVGMVWFDGRFIGMSARCSDAPACTADLLLTGMPTRALYPVIPSPPVAIGPTPSAAEPSPGTQPGLIGWTATSSGFRAGDTVNGAIRAGQRWVVTGSRNGQAAAWYSPDGSSWTQARVALPLDRSISTALGAIAIRGGVMLALGSGTPPGADAADRTYGWISRDGGATWAWAGSISRDAVLRSVVSGPAGFVAVSGWAGCCGPKNPPVALVSTDGSHWEALDAATIFGNASLNAVESDGKVYVIVGERPEAGSSDIHSVHPVVFSSTDAAHWNEANLPAVDQPGQGLVSVSARPQGFVAVGLAYASDFAQDLWTTTSTDGQAWTGSNQFDGVESPTFVGIGSAEPRLMIAAARQEAPGSTWSSTDGTASWWRDDRVPDINPSAIAFSATQVLVASNCPSYLDACGPPTLAIGAIPSR